MRKAITLIFLLFTSFCIWGANGNENTLPFYKYEISQKIQYLKQKKDSIGREAAKAEKVKNIFEEDSENQVNLILSRTFNELDSLMIIRSTLDAYPGLQAVCDTAANNFLDKFYGKVTKSSDDSTISITSTGFLEVADQAYKEFDQLIDRIILKKIVETNKGAIYSRASEGAEDEATQAENLDGAQPTDAKGFNKSLWIFISLGIGLLGLCLGIAALIFLISIQKRVFRHGGKLATYKQELDLVKTELNNAKSSNAKVISTATIVSNNKDDDWNKSRRDNRRKNSYNTNNQFTDSQQQHVAIPPKLPEKEVAKSTEIRLHAYIKTDARRLDFFKLSEDNPGDKPFVLIIANPEAEVAEFTFDQNITDKDRATIIQDRETYLPATACEISSADTANPTRIEVLSPGKAKKENGIWTVQSRMSIRIL